MHLFYKKSHIVIMILLNHIFHEGHQAGNQSLIN